MLSGPQIEEIQRLSAQDDPKLSWRRIAIKARVAPGSVARVARGVTWSGKPKTAPADESTVERRRCSGCGATIFEVPCRACALRRTRLAPRPAARIPDEVNGHESALTLEFRDPAAQARYEEAAPAQN